MAEEAVTKSLNFHSDVGVSEPPIFEQETRKAPTFKEGNPESSTFEEEEGIVETPTSQSEYVVEKDHNFEGQIVIASNFDEEIVDAPSSDVEFDKSPNFEEVIAKTPNFVEEVSNTSNILQIQPSSSFFLEIHCTSSGKVRRFSAGTEAGFAVQCINQKLVSGVPSASFIEAVKEGAEPITFGPSSILIDYGNGWKLQTVINEAYEVQRCSDEPFNEFPNVVEARDDVQSATDLGFHLPVPMEEENRQVTSEPISDIESQSLEKMDFKDTFTTNTIFNTRDELIKWTREVGRAVGMVVIIKKSEFGVSGRSSRIYFACERFGKRREYKRDSTKATSTRQRVSKRCECPFLLRGIKMPLDDQWRVRVECGHHNHPLGRHLQGSSVAGKLSPDEKEIVMKLVRAGIKPKEILRALKERDDRNESTIRTIYNCQAKLRSVRSECNSC